MKTKKPSGGPAFPKYGHTEGMTLRDYFAAKALPPCVVECWGEEDGAKHAAEGAYQIADAMIAAREEG